MRADFDEIEQYFIDKALADFRLSANSSRLLTKPFYAFRDYVLDSDFTRSVAGEAMYRLDQVLHSKLFSGHKKSFVAIDINGLNFSDIKFYEHQSSGYYVLSSVLRDGRGNPLCRFAWSTRIKDQDRASTTIMTLAVPKTGGDFTLLLKADILRVHGDAEPGGVGKLSFDAFAQFVDLMDYLREPLKRNLSKTKTGLVGTEKESFLDCLELDEYLPGKLMRHAHNQIVRAGAAQVHVTSARNIVKIAPRLDRRGIHWGNAFISYGSEKRPIYSTLLKSPKNGNMAILTCEVGSNLSRRTSMIWVEKDKATQSMKTFITSMRDGQEIKDAIAAFIEGTLIRSVTSTCLLSDPELSLAMTRRFLESGAFDTVTYSIGTALEAQINEFSNIHFDFSIMLIALGLQ